jgi:hypothetical protein
LNRKKGQLLLRQGHSEVAEELYREARRIAEEQGAKLWELRATVSLARLRRDQGRPAEARGLLAPIYGWFTEGFRSLISRIQRPCLTRSTSKPTALVAVAMPSAVKVRMWHNTISASRRARFALCLDSISSSVMPDKSGVFAKAAGQNPRHTRQSMPVP